MTKVTFMIGNGFDLNCGLKSKFTDTYEGYIEHNKNKDSNTIKKFKGIIDKNIEKWADFELALASYAKEFQSEEEIIECIRDYKIYLNDHLNNEQKLFWNNNKNILDGNNKLVSEIGKSLTQFFIGLKPNDVNNIYPHFDNQSVNYNFINFNYTNIFDNLISSAFKYKEVFSYVKSAQIDTETIHIHGKLGKELTLGLDKERQIEGIKYKLTGDGCLDLIKPYYLEQNNRKLLNDTRQKLFSSDIICVFGMSLGDSDLSWRELLASWLKFDYSSPHLVCFDKDNMDKKYNPLMQPQMMVDENRCKDDFIRFLYGDSPDETTKHIVINRLHFPVGTRIFDFREILSNYEKA